MPVSLSEIRMYGEGQALQMEQTVPVLSNLYMHILGSAFRGLPGIRKMWVQASAMTRHCRGFDPVRRTCGNLYGRWTDSKCHQSFKRNRSHSCNLHEHKDRSTGIVNESFPCQAHLQDDKMGLHKISLAG